MFDGIALDFINLHLRTLLYLHRFLAELQAVHCLVDLRASRRDAYNDARPGVAAQGALQNLGE